MQRGGAYFATALALCSAAAEAAANEQGHVGLLFPAQWTPESVVASVINVEPTAITYALDCPPKASDDCSLFVQTMTQGPRTWAYGGEWEDIMGVDEYTMNNACAVRTMNDKMVCTLGVTQVKGGRTASTEIVSTTTGLSDFVYPIPITAGIEKLQHDRPRPTKTSQAAITSTPSPTTTTSSAMTADSAPISTVLPTVNLKLAAADPTKDTAAEETTVGAEDNVQGHDDSVEGTPANVSAAASSVSRVQVTVMGLVALVCGVAML